MKSHIHIISTSQYYVNQNPQDDKILAIGLNDNKVAIKLSKNVNQSLFMKMT